MSEQKPPENPIPADAQQVADESLYECIGICMADPASGLCQGCGRPLVEPDPPECVPPS